MFSAFFKTRSILNSSRWLLLRLDFHLNTTATEIPSSPLFSPFSHLLKGHPNRSHTSLSPHCHTITNSIESIWMLIILFLVHNQDIMQQQATNLKLTESIRDKLKRQSWWNLGPNSLHISLLKLHSLTIIPLLQPGNSKSCAQYMTSRRGRAYHTSCTEQQGGICSSYTRLQLCGTFLADHAEVAGCAVMFADIAA